MGFLNKIFKKNDTVYIAYDREDENIALSVCEVLEYNGLTCWLKSRDSFGNDVSEVIKAIRDSGLCVVIYSENSKDSRFVANEVDTAFSESVPLCVFKTDPAPIKGSLEFFLSRAPRIEAHPDYKNHLQSLTRACLKSLEKSTNNIRIPENYKTKSPHDVFISYSTKDRDLAEIIRETLEDNAIKCWIAPRDIEPGKSYAKQIMSAVKDAKLHFCLFTENFQASKFTNNEQRISISAGYCPICNIYFIMESTYQNLKNRGTIACRVSDEKTYLKHHMTSNGMNLSSESILMQYGYNVSQTKDLSEYQRQKILVMIIEHEVLSKNEIYNGSVVKTKIKDFYNELISMVLGG